MTYQTTLCKGYDGWEAKSEAVIGVTPEGVRILRLRTAKTRAGLTSSARAFIRQIQNGFEVETMVIFEDFSQSNIANVPCKRITQSSIQRAHDAALTDHMDRLIAEAKAFYNVA